MMKLIFANSELDVTTIVEQAIRESIGLFNRRWRRGVMLNLQTLDLSGLLSKSFRLRYGICEKYFPCDDAVRLVPDEAEWKSGELKELVRYLDKGRSNDFRYMVVNGEKTWAAGVHAKGKWCWSVWEYGTWPFREIDFGECSSEEQCIAAVENRHGFFRRRGNGYAVHARKLRKYNERLKRAEEKEKCGKAASVEYVYLSWKSDWTGALYIEKHRIQKKTKRFVFVVRREPWTNEETGIQYPAKIERLDRRVLEREGSCWARRGYKKYYLEPPEDAIRGVSSTFENLTNESTKQDLDRAFRQMAVKAHPDAGGDKAEFKRIRQEYERLCEWKWAE